MKKILVIDDSELVSRLLKEALKVAGYDVGVAMDANQGYSMALDFHPDLILLDVQLPDVTGFELCRVIKNRDELRHIPIIMITGTAHRTEEKVKGFQLGADDYVMKPFEVPELLGRIQAILRRSERPVAIPLAVQSSAVIPLPSAMPSSSTVAPAMEPVALSFKETVSILLTHPWDFPEMAAYPPAGKALLLMAVGLTAIGVAASAGGNIQTVPAALAIAILWGIFVSVLVITSSIFGLPLSWTEGAALLSLAGLPLLIRLLGSCLFSIVTTLSPFYFTASPALFVKSGFVGLRRFDLFEGWSVILLWILLRRRPHSNAGKTRLLVAILWVIGIVLAIVFERWVVVL